MITRGEFDDLISNHSNAATERNKARSRARYELRRPLLEQVKAQAARIAQLEREVHLVRERNAELAAQRLEADDRAYYEGRIAELEAALRAVLPWLLHEIEYPGDPVEKVANGVRALLSKEA
jgi:hypothetical protein